MRSCQFSLRYTYPKQKYGQHWNYLNFFCLLETKNSPKFSGLFYIKVGAVGQSRKLFISQFVSNFNPIK
jgi:hypothetical protein